MSNFIVKYRFLLVLIFSYFVLRLINLTIIPIFNDEGIYLDWGWRELHRNIPFYSLTDGKQPFLMWMFAAFEGFISDPLIAGRLVSVIAGAFTLVGLYKLGKEVFNEKTAVLSGLFYIFIPIFSFFDRQALMESAVSATEIWIIYLFIKLFKESSAKNAVYLGLAIGISFFIKSTVLLLLVSISVVLIFAFLRKVRPENKTFLRDILTALGVSLITLIILFLQPQFWQTLSLNGRYSFGILELLRFPLSSWTYNISAFIQIAFWHLTPLIFVSILVGIFLILKSKENKQKLIVWIFLTQIFFFLLFAKGVVPRYAVPMLPLSIIFVAFFIDFYKKWKRVLVSVLIIVPIFFLFLQIFEPLEYFNKLSLLTPYSQKGEYVTQSTAGYAVTDAVSYIQNSFAPAAIVASRLDTGNPENALLAYFQDSKTIVASFLEGRMINNLSAYKCLYYKYPVFYVSRDYQFAGLEPYLEQDQRFYNPEGKSSVGIYHFKSSCSASDTLDLSSPGALLEPAK